MTKNMMPPRNPEIQVWSTGKIPETLEKQIQFTASQPDIVRVAMMADAHAGPKVPNGMAVATRTRVYPQMVGADIGCGVSILAFQGVSANLTEDKLLALLHRFSNSIPTIKNPVSKSPSCLPETCVPEMLSSDQLKKESLRDGRLQLGTLGRGNHFCELLLDESDRLWAMVHTGSRSMGQAIASFHLGKARPEDSGGLVSLFLADKTGQDYWQDMQWAIAYATENRLRILNRMADALEIFAGLIPDEDSYLDCPHNFARIENIHGVDLIIHRKSANAAESGTLGIIPGSMATSSRIVSGLGNEDSLRSSSHGAGRQLSRSESVLKTKAKDFEKQMGSVVFHRQIANQLRDEAPRAYKNLNEVMRAQRDLVKTVSILKPILNDKRVG